jgi:hypothetical protein
MAHLIRKIVGTGYSASRASDAPQPRAFLMTATITPPAGAVVRANPLDRMNDYLESLKFYLSVPGHLIDRILFIDNSASDISPLAELAAGIQHDKIVEIISFDGNDHPPAYGKTYGEFKLIDFGLANTTLLKEQDIFWKVTGRLRFRNIGEMIAALPPAYDVACDLHNLPLVGTGRLIGNRYMDLRTFSCTVRAYNLLFRKTYEPLTWRFDWRFLYRVVDDARYKLNIIPRFPIQPELEGISGRHNRAYDSGIQGTKGRLRTVLRRFAPWLWI